MKIHEYQAKELLSAAGAALPRGIVALSPKEAEQAFDKLGGRPVVLKAQIHAGGRGKGRFKTPPSPPSQGGDKTVSPPSQGGDTGGVSGVKYLRGRDEVGPVADVMLKHPLVTKQTGEHGQRVSKVLVQAAADIAREVYLGMVVDRALGLPVLMACAEGGVEIEEVAAKSPEKILKAVVNPDAGLAAHQARRLAFDLGFPAEQAPKAEALMTALCRVFLDKDCSLAEINPVAVTPQGDVLALDAKMTFDDNALFRHPDIEKLRDETEENPAELRAARAGLSYISLNGNIGCLVNGAGLAMSTMDIIKYHGGAPANFLDVGGGVTPEGAVEAFRIILSDARVQGVLVNIFGGIAKCDLIAEALVKAGREVGFKVPIVVRLEGTNVDKARQILAGASKELTTLQSATGMADAARKVVAAAR